MGFDLEQTARIEHAARACWPALEQVEYDGWLLRFADGYTKRSNSVNPVTASALDSDRKIEECERRYRARGLPPIFRLTLLAPSSLDGQLEARGYRKIDTTCVMVADAGPIPPRASACVQQVLIAEWLDVAEMLSPLDPGQAKARRALFARMPKTLCPMISVEDDEPVGLVLGSLHDGLLGIFHLLVAEAARGGGRGTALTQALLLWGREQGAERCYLQVEASNEIARALYAKCRFEDAYTYWYRIAGNQAARLS